MKNQPIGIFDSGIGGLTVANAIVRHLPNESIIYFGDTAHLPYGDKSADAIRYYSIGITRFLLEKGCKMIVIACNSAASTSNKVLTDFFKGQTIFVNVVEPLVREVVAQKFRKVGVIATKATTRSGIYESKLKQLQPNLEVATLATPLLVPMIEEGFVHNNISKTIIYNYLESKELEEIDALLLACTHYPLIKKEIEEYYQNRVKVFDSSEVVAADVKYYLQKYHLQNDQARQPHQFYVSDYTPSFEETTRLFYPEKIELAHYPLWKE